MLIANENGKHFQLSELGSTAWDSPRSVVACGDLPQALVHHYNECNKSFP